MALQLETSWPQNLLLQPWAEGFELIMLNWWLEFQQIVLGDLTLKNPLNYAISNGK
jgi:hypothetical protein